MMALNAGGPVDSSTKSASSGSPPMPSSRGIVGKGLGSRRLRSKGTIAGFVHGKTSEGPAVSSGPELNGEISTSDNASSTTERNQPQHAVDPSAPPAKPCHSARLALLACQNAIRLGPKTQLGLCPPGRARRSVQQALRNRSRSGPRASRTPSLRLDSEMGGYYGLDKMLGPEAFEKMDSQEEEYLSSTNTFDVDSDEEASSGDEDEIVHMEDVIEPDAGPSLDDEKKYATLREPLFNPVGSDPALSTPGGGPSGSASSGKLPFNRRKLRYFDSVTAADRSRARAYLRQEAIKGKQRDGIMLAKKLRRMQRREKRRLLLERGETPDFDSDDENEDPNEKALLTSGISQFKEPMTASMSAALVLESLSLNPLGSLEGMDKCYDGIVAAGVALLDSQLVTTSDKDKPRPGRSEIMAALEPLLITSLEPASGEVILHLAKLRRMCGTPRYQRRFVQRVAPCLIRPPHAAMWCLRHQNDMEPILAAAELILDSAFNTFKKGWYERGKLLLADSVRKKTLDSAAQQLKNLSSEPEDGLGLALNSTGHGHRRPTHKLVTGATPNKDAPLAEWEVIAVDRQIRISISNILSNDWSRVALVSKDVEQATKLRRANSNASHASSAPGGITRSRSGGESPKNLAPLSPPRPTPISGNPPLSPPSSKTAKALTPPATESMESVFGPSFASQPLSEAPGAVPPPPSTLISPPMTRRKSLDEDAESSSLHKGQFTAPSATTNAVARPDSTTSPAQTPPRSPVSAVSEEMASSAQLQPTTKPLPQAAAPPASPSRTGGESGTAPNVVSSPSHPSFASLERVERAPLSPSNSISSEAVPYRPASSASSVASATTVSSQPSHYRMLTSTAAERKRTVAACRALRAQISRFEEAFMQLHGRAPKGAAERAPLATTYAQYREWKRAIRADAACRIQALFRGARARWTLLRSNNPRMARVVMTRAGRASFGVPMASQEAKSVINEDPLKSLRIPMEIGPADGKGLGLGPSMNVGGRNSATGQSSFVDDPFSTSPSSAAGTTLWSTPGRRGGGDAFPKASSTPPPYSSSPTASPSPTAAVPNYQHLSLPELQAHKKDLKQQLKQYDMNFAREHGRMPVKAEKEPIRHLYENYNALKSQITMLEQEGQHLPPTALQSPSTRPAAPRARSPPQPDSSEDSSPSASPIVPSRPKRKPTARASPPLADPPPASTPSGNPSQDLAALKAEKQKLHQMLRSYEKDFFKEHKRQVSSFADIRPVAQQYRRYKEIKKAIAALQQQLQQSGADRDRS